MITDIDSRDSQIHAWSLHGDYEHEVTLTDGSIADLKAEFVVDRFTVARRDLVFELTRIKDGLSVHLKWQGLHRIEVSGTELDLEAEADLGFLGARLLTPFPPNTLAFQIDTDELEVRCSCDSFAISTSTEPLQ